MTDFGPLPRGFREVYGPESRYGRLVIGVRENPATFWVHARGFIVPRLIKQDLEYAAAFGRGHPEGWDYVVDTTRVKAIHPWNMVLLTRIRRLPNLSRHVVIAPSRMVQFGMLMASLFVRPDIVVTDVDEALRELERAAPDESE